MIYHFRFSTHLANIHKHEKKREIGEGPVFSDKHIEASISKLSR